MIEQDEKQELLYVGRYRVVGLFFLLCFVVVLGKAWWLQIVVAEENIERGAWDSRGVAEVSGARGWIYDRNGSPLALTSRSFDFWWDPRFTFQAEPDEIDEVLDFLERFPGFDRAEAEGFRNQDPSTLSAYRVVARRVGASEAAEIQMGIQRLRRSSVRRNENIRRIYPAANVAARVIGMMDGRALRGVSGIEASRNELLEQQVREMEVLKTSKGRSFAMDELPDLSLLAGASVELTLDINLQAAVEQALSESMEHFEATAAYAVVSRVGTGDLLALASVPQMDRQGPLDDSASIWSEPTISQQFEPGSTAKIFTFAAALDQGLIDYNTVFDCSNGAIRVDGITLRDPYCRGEIEAWDVLRVSSNIGAMRIGFRMSQESHLDYLSRFGFGRRLGVPLASEAAGTLPRRDRPWRPSTQATVSYGYGFDATLLQLNMATAVIANDGVRVDPVLIRRIVGPTGERFFEAPNDPGERVVSRHTARLTTRALTTVTEDRGTALRARVPGYQVAGKTGTAQIVGPNGYEEGAYRAFFTGFVPADAPRFVITVMVERPNTSIGYYGGTVAAPVFSEIARRALTLDGLSVETGSDAPSRHAARDEEEEPTAGIEAPAPPTITQGPRMVPDFHGMRAGEVLELARQLELEVRIEGAGVVTSQSLEPLTPATAGMSLSVQLGGGAW